MIKKAIKLHPALGNLMRFTSLRRSQRLTEQIFILVFVLLVLPNTRTLHVTNIIVPPFVDVRDVVMLSCSYIIGSQKLNSVKWYKNEKEFYR